VSAAIGSYFHITYLAISHGGTTQISQTTDWPRSGSDAPLQTKLVAELSLPTETRFTNIHGLGRFVAVQQAASVTVYDLELNQEYDVPIIGVKKQLNQPIPWLDQFHFWSDGTGYARQYEFDGTNQTSIVKVAPGFAASYDEPKEFLYSVGATKSGYSIQATAMRVE
jgi:hypothetical protein